MSNREVIGANKKPQVCPGGNRVRAQQHRRPVGSIQDYEFRVAVSRANARVMERGVRVRR